MRAPFLSTLAVCSMLATPSLAADTAKRSSSTPRIVCMNSTKDGSRAVQGTDLVIEAGEKVKDVVAVDGNVIVRKGAVVEDAVSVRGRVIIEAGAHVTGSAVSIGGDVRIRSGAHVDGSAVALGGRLTVDSESDVKGDRVGLSFELGGEDIIRGLINEALDKDLRCHILDDKEV
ncbi:hypothetical protein DRW03_08825 [Corallococcus sp. H22C18031201]|uniref:hypothetical protein n=1 Tax=Citreicoccus inhibens TaxID=2849499 RepID=UPI000E7270F9|nr:hypothetical protein [Citreicoccus inhibens]MBU8894612.1 hypothetical protein [Citreicoccus inhibens]RJS25199.1 hypothetical protein DRW03_08825 [Corallococcus sp. H22C18031201]